MSKRGHGAHIVKFGFTPTVGRGRLQRYRDSEGHTFYRKEDYAKKTTKRK